MTNLPGFFTKNSSSAINLPLLPLRDIVVFPYMVVPLFVGRAKSVHALTDSMSKNKRVFLATQSNPVIDNPKEAEISRVGTIGKVLQLLKLPDGTVKALVEGETRARIVRFISKDEFFFVEVESIAEDIPNTESEALNRAVLQSFEEYSKYNKEISKNLLRNISSLSDISQTTDTLSSYFSFKIKDRLKLLETEFLNERLILLLSLIKQEVEIIKMGRKIKVRVKEQMDKTQRKYYLNEQMRAIKKEMGTEDDELGDDLKDLEERINEKKMSEECTKKVMHEFKKLKMMAPMSAEAAVVRNYIDWLINLPWYDVSEVSKDLNKAEEILNDDHYGLKKPKERILEYLAVQSLVEKVRGPILCFIGPPGVGKTSLAGSVSRATGREFVRLSLGGVRDEAEIRGHRRTYIGAMPGKIIQSLKKIGTNNPVFCLDEVDKMSMDFRGDPSAALLEVLDPEQNDAFNDHYLDVDYDLSDILFITTANILTDIPFPLQDRMETIQLSGYTEYEKYKIAENFLLPKQINFNGLKDKNVCFSKDAIMMIIQRYTREAGVRNLERKISAICRKIAKEIVKDKKDADSFKITPEEVKKYLGTYRFKYGQIEDRDQIGIVTGLAWTQLGGELLYVESLVMPGKGDLIMTGKLGDVMKESVKAAVSYVRSRAKLLNIDYNFHKAFDIHIHVPEGAIPKDGPSAGITMCTSIVSSLTKTSVHRDVAMTGELTLRGRILSIGGLKEKVLAAHRGGIKKILIPEENEKDLKDISKKITSQIEMVTVNHMDEVLPHALISK
mmetsp:Transcript_22254/g.10660  ORF Transcript_22254/g.10660 Transcript_22254/m.10660 type:complete len:784 (+) Transcript_22254:3775-6126(+)